MQIAHSTPDGDVGVLQAPAACWKNLLFMRDGRSVFGFHSFSTEIAARDAIAEGEALFAEMMVVYRDVLVFNVGKERLLYLASEYSHAIPMPFREGQS